MNVIPKLRRSASNSLVVCNFTTYNVKKREFSPRIRTWVLRDAATASYFHVAFRVNAMTAATAVATAATVYSANRVESAWSKLSGPLFHAATEVCGLSKNHQWKPETHWWNGQMDDAVQQEKCARFKVYITLKKGTRWLRPRRQRLSSMASNLLYSWQSLR